MLVAAAAAPKGVHSLRGSLEWTEAELYADGLDTIPIGNSFRRPQNNGGSFPETSVDGDRRTTAVLVDEHADMVLHQQGVDTAAGGTSISGRIDATGEFMWPPR